MVDKMNYINIDISGKEYKGKKNKYILNMLFKISVVACIILSMVFLKLNFNLKNNYEKNKSEYQNSEKQSEKEIYQKEEDIKKIETEINNTIINEKQKDVIAKILKEADGIEFTQIFNKIEKSLENVNVKTERFTYNNGLIMITIEYFEAEEMDKAIQELEKEFSQVIITEKLENKIKVELRWEI